MKDLHSGVWVQIEGGHYIRLGKYLRAMTNILALWTYKS